MAGRQGKVSVSVTADPSGLEKGLRGAEGDLSRFGKRTEGHMHGLRTAALGAGAALTGGVVIGLKQSFDAAVEAEKSHKSLEAQLKALGISYKAHSKQIDEVIQKTSKLSGLDDEDLTNAFTNVVRATGSVNVGLKDMAVVADLARAKHMGVAQAGQLVAKVHSGNVGALKRLGIAIDPVTKAQDHLRDSVKHATVEQQRAAKEADKTASAQKALGILQQKLGGQAAAYGKTAAGAQDRFRVAMENLKETAGAKLLPVVSKLATKAADFVQQMVDGKGAGGRFAAALQDVYGQVKPIVDFFVQHPKFIGVAIGAWALYKAAARASALYTQTQLLNSFRGQALAKQEAAAAAAGAASGGKFGGTAATRGGKALLAFGWAGIGVSIAHALGLDKSIIKQFDEAINGNHNLEDKMIAAGTKFGKQMADGMNKGLQLGLQLSAIANNSLHPGPHGPTPNKPNPVTKPPGGGGFGNQTFRMGGGSTAGPGASMGAAWGNPMAGTASLRKAPNASDVFGIGGNKAHRADVIQGKLDLVDAQEAAGVIGAETAINKRYAITNEAVRGGFGPIGYKAGLGFKATRREAITAQKARRKAKTSKTTHAAYNLYVTRWNLIQEMEDAGQYTHAEANAWRLVLIDNALNHKGEFSGKRLTGHEKRLVLADKQSLAAEPADPTTFAGTAFDDAALTAAQVDTPNDVSDDKNVLTGRLGIAQANYAAAKAAGDREGMATWGALVLSLGQSIDGLAPSADKTPDQQAVLDQANLRATVAQNAAAISGAELNTFMGAQSIGYGGPVIVFKVGETEFAKAAVQSLGRQPAITTSRTALGV